MKDRTSTPTMTKQTSQPRSSRSLYAEARRFESAARNMTEGRYDGVDSTGRQWTVDELYARSSACRAAGRNAERAENAAPATKTGGA